MFADNAPWVATIVAFVTVGCASSAASPFASSTSTSTSTSTSSAASGTGGSPASSSANVGGSFDPTGGGGSGGGGKPSVPNLVPNGDFSQGNALFGSDYSYAVDNTTEGEYTVGPSPQAFNGGLLAVGDHTSGNGSMFIGNGKPTPDRVWYSESIPVTPDTTYYFEAWVLNACCTGSPGPQGPSVLSFYANDVLLGTRTSQQLGVWEPLGTTWKSDSAKTVTLKLVNANTDVWGNDFAVDDVFLGTESSIPTPK